MTALHAPRPVRIGLAVIAAAALASTLALVTAGTATAGNPSLAKNSHGHLANGKSLPHVSGGTEVAFDEERAQAGDAASGTAAGSDLPPDATASAVGCANRGSATNPRVNQDCTARRQAEEQIAINPSDPSNLVAGQNDSRIGFNHCGFDYSLDSGKTWGDGIPPYSQHLSPIGHVYDAASDPTVTFAGTPSAAWYSCIVFDINSNASGLFASPSTAGLKGSAYANIGAGASRYVVAETADGHTFYDKQFIAGAPDGSVYVTFTRFLSDQKCSTGNNPGAYCSSEIFLSKWDPTAKFGTETTGHGAWSTPISISGASKALCVGGNANDNKADPTACNFNQGSMPVVLADRSVFVVWNNGNTPTLLNQQLGRVISAAGLPTGSVIKVGQDDETNLGLCDFGRGAEECVLGLNVRTNDFPAISTDPANPRHLVAVWQDSRRSEATTGNYNLVVSDSTDGGGSWSDASGKGTVITAGTDSLSQPSVTVTASGRTAVSAYRATAKKVVAGDGTFGYGMYVRSGPAFGAYQPVSEGQTLPSPQDNVTQRGFLGDYSSIDSVGETVYPIWADTRNSSSAGPDEDVFVKAVTLG